MPRAVLAPVVPLRAMTVADVLDGGFRLLRAAPAAVLAPALVVAVLVAVADTAVRLAVDPAATEVGAVGGALASALLVQLVAAALGTVGVAAVGCFVAGVLVCTLEGTAPRLPAVWRLVRGRLPVAVAVGVVVALTQTVALAFCVVPGVWLWGLWALAVPAVVVERASVFGALGRSRQLEGFWRVFGLRLLAVVATTAFGYLFGVPATLLAGLDATSTTLDAAITALGTLLTSAVVLPLRAAVDVMLYLDQRIRREAFDVTVALRRRDAAPAVPVR